MFLCSHSEIGKGGSKSHMQWSIVLIGIRCTEEWNFLKTNLTHIHSIPYFYDSDII